MSEVGRDSPTRLSPPRTIQNSPNPPRTGLACSRGIRDSIREGILLGQRGGISGGILRGKDVSHVAESVMCAPVTETVANFFPEVEGNLTKITWAHAVNNKTMLNKTLEGELEDWSRLLDS